MTKKGVLFLFILILFSSFNPLIHSTDILTDQNQSDCTSIRLNTHSSPPSFISFFLRLAHLPSLSIGVIRDKSLSTFFYGETTRGQGNTPTKNTVYYAGSISKTVTATAILQLYEQGKVSLEDDINTYLPFPLRHPSYPTKPITIHMLLTHSSSLSNNQRRLFTYFSIFHYPREWLGEYLSSNGSLYYEDNWNEYEPGEAIYYSSVGYELLAFIVEQVSNVTFEHYCKQNIFRPLRMDNTSFSLSDINQSLMASIYAYVPGFYIPLPIYQNHNTGAGGILTTIEDLSHYLYMHMNNGSFENSSILKSETITLMHQAHCEHLPIKDAFDDGRNYGLGWIIWPEEAVKVSGGYQGHYGNVPGGISSLTISNSSGLILMSNQWLFYQPLQMMTMSWLRNYFHQYHTIT